MSLRHRFLSTTCLTVAMAAAFGVGGNRALANPQDGVVVGGAASIISNGQKLDIIQTTDRAVIDWNKFDIAPDEHTQFYQPGSSSIILNRIRSTTSSTIAGKLTANGNVILVNPNGILFSKTATVDVNGLVATTADIDNHDFMNGSLDFNKTGNPNAVIENQGLISAKDSGLVGLVAPNVINSGVIQAKLGRAQLSSGDSVTIDFYGDGLLEVKASDALTSQSVTNTGIINAAGGTIAMTAAAARSTVNSVVKVSGELHAPSVGVRNGKIIIGAAGSNAVAGNKSADKGKKTGVSTVLVDGVLDVTGQNPGETGGTITITADHIGILEGAKIDASGYNGGGTIHIGGDYLGMGETPTALVTLIQPNVEIKANALGNGNGGEVIVYSDDRTEFSGSIEAMGAGEDGNGGFTETSGKGNLLAMGTVRLNAGGRRGKAGTWLMDPADITITATTNSGNTGNPNFTATATASQVSAASIKANLDAGTNVTIITSNDAYAGNGDITVSSAITTTGTGSLTLSAYRNIGISAAITLQGGSLTLRSDNTGAGNGAIRVYGASDIATNGGNIIMGGGSGAITAGSGYAVGNSTFINGVAISSNLNAGGGNIIINGQSDTSSTIGRYGVAIFGNLNVVTSGSGSISLNGIAKGTGDQSHGVGFYGLMQTAAGTISIVGSSTVTAAGSYGIILDGSSAQTKVQSTSGAITINGVGSPNATANGIGLRLKTDVQILSTSGSITLIAEAPTISDTINANGTILVNSGSGPLNVNVDVWSATMNAVNLTTTGTLTIAPKTAGKTVSIGSSAANLQISNSYLAYLTASSYVFGSTTTGDLTVNTSKDFADKSVTFLSGKDIILADTLTKATGTGTANYLFQANENIYNSGSAGITATNGKINLTLNADYDQLTVLGGAIYLTGGTINTNGGNILFGGGMAPASGFATGSSTTYSIGINLSGVTVNAAGGNIALRGQGFNDAAAYRVGVSAVSGALISTSGTGTITIDGVKGNTVGSSYALQIDAATIQSANGDILLKTTGSGGKIRWGDNTVIRTTGATGNINVSATQEIWFCNFTGCAANNSVTMTTAGGAIDISAPTIYNSASNITVFGGASTTGNITINADIFSFDSTFSSQTTGVTTIRPYSAGATMAVGTTGSTLNLSNALLSQISSGSYVFGSILSSDVTVNTSNDFVNKNVTFLSGRDIILAGNLTKATGAGAANYLFQAYRNIYNSNNAGVSASAGQINLTLQSDYDADSSGAITLASGSFLTNGGNMTMGGGAGTITAGNGYAVGNAIQSIGVSISSILSAGGGNIIINGKGNNGTADGNYGVYMNSAVSTTGSGAITINAIAQGTGASASNYGVLLENATALSTVNGILTLNGTSASSSGTNNIGIYANGAPTVQTTGSGNLVLNGTSLSTGGNGKGMYLTSGMFRATGTGNIVMNGTASAVSTGVFNIGIQSGATISNQGTGTLTLTGIGGGTGSGAGNSYGILLAGGGGISTVNGNMIVNASGGNNTGGGNQGLFISASNMLRTTGSGSLTVNAKAGASSGVGLYATASNSVVTTGTGNLTVYADTLSLSIANVINSAGVLTMAPYSNGTMGVGASSGYTLNLDNTTLGYLNGASYVFGSLLTGTGTANTSDLTVNTTNDFVNKNVTFLSGRDIILAGTLTKGTGTGTVNYVFQAYRNIYNSSNAGINAAAGVINVTLQSDYDGNDDGAISTTGGAINTNGGNITIGGGTGTITAGSGYAVGSAAFNTGLYLGTILNAAGGHIIANGKSYLATVDSKYGIQTAAAISTTGSGTITLNGIARGTANNNDSFGVYLQSGLTAVDGNISVTGSGGGAGTGARNYGIAFSSAGGYTKTTGAGNLIVNGTGGLGSGGSQVGVFINYTGAIQSAGTGTITVVGTGGTSSGGANWGIYSAIPGITSVGGAITLTGTGGSGTGNGNVGIIAGGITNTGNGTITLNGTGGGSANSGANYGVRITNSTTVLAANGAITINATGGGAGTGATNYGLYVESGTVKTTGTGSIIATGTGGNLAGTGSTNHGIYSSVANGIQTTGSGSIILRGVKGGTATSYGIVGDLANEYVTTGTGNITLYTDTLSMTAANTVNSAGILTIAPYSNASLGVGYASGYTLNLDNTTLGNMNGASYVFGSVITGTGTANTSDVTLNTSKDFVNKNVSVVSGRDIILAGNLTKATGTGTANYVFQAYRDIYNSIGVGISATTGLINLILQSDYDGDNYGGIYLGGGTINTRGGNITMGGGTGTITAGSGYASGGSIYKRGIVINSATLNAAGGNIIINGQGWQNAASNNDSFGIGSNSSTFSTTGSGTISLNGLGGGVGGTVYNHGIQITNSSISTVDGDLSLIGKVIETGFGAKAFSFSNTTLQTTGNGNINLTDAGPLGGGIEGFGSSTTITSARNITYAGHAFFSATAIWTWSAANTITVKPYTATTTMGVGSGAGTFSVADAMIAKMTAPNLVFGSTTSGDVTVNSGNDFGTKNVSFISGNDVILAGNLTKATGAGTANYVFQAYRDIYNTNSAGISATTGLINLTLQSDYDADNSGAILLTGGSFLTNGGNITIGGGSGTITAGNGYAAGNASNPHGVSISSSMNAGGGNIIVNGKGYIGGTAASSNYGVSLQAGSNIQSSGNGTISVYGTGGNTTGGYNFGIAASGTLSTENGALLLAGTSINPSNGFAIALSSASNATLQTVNGAISLVGITGTGYGGIRDFAGSTIKATGTGTISITAPQEIRFSNWSGTAATTSITTVGGAISFSAPFVNVNSLHTLNVGNGSTTGNITYNTDILSSGLLNSQTSGLTTIKNYSANTSIGLGSGAGTLNISNAALSQIMSGSYVFGSATAGDMVINTTKDFGDKPVTFISGNHIILAGTLTKSTGTGTANYAFQANGNISNSGSAGVAATAGAINLTMTSDQDVSGAGNIVLTSAPLTVNGGTITLNSNGQTITQSGVIGGDETINSANGAVSLGVLNGDVAGTRNLTVNAGAATLTTTGVVGGTTKLNNITVNADDIVLGANIAGTGTLTLQPTSTTRVVNINGGIADGTNFNLSTAEIGYLVDGWNQINIGNSASTADLGIGSSTWVDPVTFRSASRKTIYSLTGTGNASFTTSGGGWIDLYGNIGTAGGAVNLSSNYVYLAAAGKSIITNGGHITLPSLNLSGNGLTLDAGTGNITFSADVRGTNDLTATANNIYTTLAWGTTTALGNVNLTSAGSITLPAITTAAGKTVTVNVTGTGNSITTTGAIATGTVGNITLTADDLVLGGNLSGTGILTIKPTTASQFINVNNGAGGLNISTAELAYLSNGWGTIRLGRSDSTNRMRIGDYGPSGGVTFQDNLVFANYANVWNLNLVDGATLNAPFGIDLYSSLTTNGGTVTTGNIYGSSATVNTNGGAISVASLGTWNNTSGLTVNSGGGNITVIGGFIEGGTPSGIRNFILNAGTGNISFGGASNTGANVSLTADTINFNGYAWGNTKPLGTVSLTSTNAMTLPSMTASSIFAQTTGAGSDITIGAGKTLTASGAGNALTLVSQRNFINNSGSATPLILTGTGRYLVYSGNPANDVLNGMTSGFVRYGCTYGGLCPAGTTIPASGNGSIYVYQPTLTVTPIAINTIYGDAAPSLSGYSYTVSGYLTGAAGSDSGVDILTGTLTGSTSYVQGNDAGIYNLNYSAGTLASGLGYAVVYANNAAGITVGKRTLVTDLTGVVSKIYDGNNTASLNSGNYTLGNVYGSDVLAIANIAGSYNDQNAGTGKNVTVTGLTLTGAKSSNYTLGSTSVTGAVGAIAQKALTLVGLGASDKVYDGNRNSTLTGTASFSGLVGSDDVILGGTGVGTFADKDVGTGKTVTVTGYSISGTDANNYSFAQPTGLSATITPKALTLVGLGASHKIYDGTVNATLTGTAAFSGLVGSDDVTLGGTGVGTFSDKDTGTGKTVTVSGYSISGTDANNYSFAQPTGIVANITQKLLTLIGLGANDKIYDGNRNATLTGTASLSGLVGLDDVILGGAGVGTFADKDVGTGKAVAVTGYSISGTDANNYSLGQPTGLSATITPKALTLVGLGASHKTYDGTVNATLTGTASFSGLVGSDVVTLGGTGVGTFAGKNVGTGKAVTVTGYAISGTDANNYSFTQPTGLIADITQKILTVTAANQSVTYGGAVPVGGVTYSGFVAGENSTFLTTAPIVTSVLSGVQDAGTYSGNFNATGGVDLNYSFNYVAGDLIVLPRALAVITDNLNNAAGNSNPVFTGSHNLLSSDAALISWVYAPIGYNGDAGIYVIGATATDPTGRLNNYIRTNHYGLYNVGVPPLPPAPVIPVISPQIIGRIAMDISVPTFVIVEIPTYNSAGEVVSTQKEWIDTSNLSNGNQLTNSNELSLSYSEELKLLLSVQR